MIRPLSMCSALCLSFASVSYAEGGKPLDLMMPMAFGDLTEKEKVLYVSGVMDGQAFMLYGASHPDLDPMVDCIKSQGIERLTQLTETLLVIHAEDLKYPMPWAISRALGAMCEEHRKKAGRNDSK